MNGGYVYLDKKLSEDIIANSGSAGDHEFNNAYNIALNCVNTSKYLIIAGDVDGNHSMAPAFYTISESPAIIVICVYGDSAVLVTFAKETPNKYTIGG